MRVRGEGLRREPNRAYALPNVLTREVDRDGSAATTTSSAAPAPAASDLALQLEQSARQKITADGWAFADADSYSYIGAASELYANHSYAVRLPPWNPYSQAEPPLGYCRPPGYSSFLAALVHAKLENTHESYRWFSHRLNEDATLRFWRSRSHGQPGRRRRCAKLRRAWRTKGPDLAQELQAACRAGARHVEFALCACAVVTRRFRHR